MDADGAGYIIERQEAGSAAWRPITYCRSLSYAETVAGAGAKRRIGLAYRAIGRSTGTETPLRVEAARAAS